MKTILGPMRLPFLILTPACVLLGVATAYKTNGSFDLLNALLALTGALAAHISVNAFNEYSDFKSGLDAKTERTPFSGGSGTLPANPSKANRALWVAVVSLIIILGTGIYFIAIWGWAILPLGILGILVILSYTPVLTRFPLLCLIAPGLGFGPFMVMGTDFVLTGNYSMMAFLASLVPFFLVSNLLLLNQFPDIEADKSVGRKHFPIVLGRQGSSYLFLVFLILNYLVIIFAVSDNFLPKSSLLGLFTLLLSVPLIIGVFRNADHIKKLIPFMALNVLVNILTPVLVGIGLFLG